MGRHSCSSSSSSLKPKLRKGLWSPEEDEKLYNYITRFGVGCWSSVPKDAGLQRCGKSCRLRWINYLRPDVKRGMFSQEEEDLIIRLHEILGNRWAQIAAQLPGRTDNEIKNFWNSCLKKKLMKQGIDPSTHKPLPEEKEASDHENNVIEMPTTSNLLPNNINSSYYNEVLMTEWSAIESKPLFNPLLPFLGYPEESNPMQYNSDHFVQYHPPLKQGFDEKIFESSSTICGFPSSMPRLTSFDQGSFNENDFSNSSAVLSDAKESSCNSSNISCSYNGFQGIKIEHPAAGPIWDGPENKMDSLLFQGMNEIKSEEGNLNSWQENHLHAQNADDFRSYTLFSDDDFNHI